MSTVLQKKDIHSLSEKLEQFAKSLPEQEQNVLGWILARSSAVAASELSDDALDGVAGGQGDLSTQLAQAAGFDAVSGRESKVTTSWTYSF